MAVGWHGQLIAVFPDLDAVAVVTAHKLVRFGDVIRGVSAAVKSESALPPNPNDAERLVNPHSPDEVVILSTFEAALV